MAINIIDWIRHHQIDITRKRSNRPLITLAFAQSIDGSLARKQGVRTHISGKSSAVLTHQIRAIHKGIMIGSGTLLSDNPKLDVRYVDGQNPIPILLDSDLKIPVNANILKSTTGSLIFCSDSVDAEKKKLIKNQQVKIIPLSKDENRLLPLEKILEILNEMNISSVMVEGGPKLINSFMKKNLWDIAVVTIAPVWMGGYGLSHFQFEDDIFMKNIEYVPVDEDIILLGTRE